LERRNEDKERRIMEERRNKVLNVLSRLQEDTPRRGESSKGCCNFEDCEFIMESKMGKKATSSSWTP